MKRPSILGVVIASAFLCAVPFSVHWQPTKISLSFDSANAVIGRPLTAGNVAGVHRRAERRAYRIDWRVAWLGLCQSKIAPLDTVRLAEIL